VTDTRGKLSVRTLGSITAIEVIASGRGIRELARLRKVYGAGRWRKMKGIAKVELPDGVAMRAEVHWYERHGLGRREMKVKRLLGEEE
jgi:hypothetical protein